MERDQLVKILGPTRKYHIIAIIFNYHITDVTAVVFFEGTR